MTFKKDIQINDIISFFVIFILQMIWEIDKKLINFEIHMTDFNQEQLGEKLSHFNKVFDEITDSIVFGLQKKSLTKRQNSYQGKLNEDLLNQNENERTWEFLFNDLCKREPDKYLVAFFKKLVKDEDKVLNYLTDDTCGCIKKSVEIQDVIFEYYQSSRFQEISNKYDYYKPLQFQLINGLGDIEQLAATYFLSSRKQTVMPNEGLIVYSLAIAGKEQKALEYLDFLVQEVIRGETKYISYSPENNPFLELCFSANAKINREATRLLYLYFEALPLGTSVWSDLKDILAFKNIDKLKEIYLIKFEELEKLNLKDDYNQRVYKSFIAGAAKYIAAELGMVYWDSFLRRRERDYSFKNTAYYIAFEVAKSGKVRKKDKVDLVHYVRDNCESEIELGAFIMKVLEIFPNVTIEEMETFLPKELKKKSRNWENKFEELSQGQWLTQDQCDIQQMLNEREFGN